jgi:hypothetical protein
MRAHGVDVPDPQVGNGGIMIQKGSGPKIDPQSPAFRSAQKACATYLPGGGPGRNGVQRSEGNGTGASLDSESGKP